MFVPNSEGTDTFKIPFVGFGYNEIASKLKLSELKNLDKEVLRMIDDFNVIEEDETVFIPVCALNGMDISSFLNNSNSPNLITNEGGSTFITARRIKKGEELTTSYETFDYKYREL